MLPTTQISDIAITPCKYNDYLYYTSCILLRTAYVIKRKFYFYGMILVKIYRVGGKLSKWFYINIAILIFAFISIGTNYHGIHMLIGGLGLFFIIYNWTRHAVFTTIRSSNNRKMNIRLARFSKKVLPIHKWTGTAGLIIIIIHAVLVFNRYGILLSYMKLTSGLVAGIVLIIMVVTGWLRWYRTTVKRRYIHWTTGFILIAAIVIHLLL